MFICVCVFFFSSSSGRPGSINLGRVGWGGWGWLPESLECFFHSPPLPPDRSRVGGISWCLRAKLLFCLDSGGRGGGRGGRDGDWIQPLLTHTVCNEVRICREREREKKTKTQTDVQTENGYSTPTSVHLPRAASGRLLGGGGGFFFMTATPKCLSSQTERQYSRTSILGAPFMRLFVCTFFYSFFCHGGGQ